MVDVAPPASVPDADTPDAPAPGAGTGSVDVTGFDLAHLPGLARGMWTLLEAVHAVTYFSPESAAAFEAVGLRGFWRGYFAGRAAPLGRVGSGPVTALFFSFAPGMAARALPAVWQLAEPDVALAARRAGAAATLRRAVVEAGVDPQVQDLADRIWPVAQGAATDGRALGAANAVLPRPDDPYEAIWQATATLRELRGDGHVAALVTAGLSGIEVLALRAAGDLHRPVLQPARGWTDQEWDAAAADLVRRGLLHLAGGAVVLTPDGRQLLLEVERSTDRLAGQPWAALAASGEVHRLATDLGPLAAATAGVFPSINPIGLPGAWDPVAEPEGLHWAPPGPAH